MSGVRVSVSDANVVTLAFACPSCSTEIGTRCTPADLLTLGEEVGECRVCGTELWLTPEFEDRAGFAALCEAMAGSASKVSPA